MATQVQSGLISDSSVSSGTIADGQVSTADIADGAVTSAKIADSTISTSDIANSAVTTSKIASGVSITGSLNGNSSSSTTFNSTRLNYKGSTDSAVAGQLMWKHYGNSHTIFDASNSTSPDGTGINNTDASVAWTATYPTLMGWNGTSTYGVRVDSARIADYATTIADNSVTTSKIADGNITPAKLNGGQTGSPPIYGIRAWVNMNGDPDVSNSSRVRASGNISSVVRERAGEFTVYFSTPMPDTNYAVILTSSSLYSQERDNTFSGKIISDYMTTTSFVVRFEKSDATTDNTFDPVVASIIVIR